MALITTPTVLILGAGASAPYGFPVGRALRELIINKLGSSDIVRLLMNLGFRDRLISEFRTEFKYSQKQSIDSFLDLRKEFTDLGKAVIAAMLIPFELPDTLVDETSPLAAKRETVGKPWYSFLADRLTEIGEGRYGDHQLTIINFNYDRSLERAMFMALRSSFGLKPKEAVDKIGSTPIFYIHGKLGYLPDSHEHPQREYNPELTTEGISVASAGIRVVHEEVSTHKDLESAKMALAASERIAFLGFGFHGANLDRLGLNRKFAWDNKYIYGSTYGMTEHQVKNVQARLHAASAHSSLLMPGMGDRRMGFDCLDALNNYPIID